MPDLEITATGNVTGAVSALEKVDKALEEVSSSAAKVPPALNKVQAELNKTTAAAKVADTKLSEFSKTGNVFAATIPKVAAPLKEVGESLVDISKDTKIADVATQALNKTVAKSVDPAEEATDAFAEVGTSLIEGGIVAGIALALPLLVKFGLSLFDASKEAMFLADQQRRLDEFSAAAAVSFGKEVSSLLILRGAIESTAVPMDTRLQAIKDLKKEFPGLFDGLSNEQLLTGNVADAYNRATVAILRKARATAAATQLDKINAEKLKILEQAELDRTATLEKSAKQQDKIIKNAAIGPLGTIGKTKADLQKEIITLYNVRAKGYQAAIDQLNKQQAFYLKIAIDGADQTIKIEEKKIEKIKKVHEEGAKIINRAAKELYFGEAPTLTTGAGLSPTMLLTPKLQIEISPAEQQKILDAFNKFILNEKLKEAINASIDTLINDTISTVASAVGDALAGNQDALPALFDNLIKGIGSQVSELGKYLVKVGLEMLLAKKAIQALGLTPQGAIIAGIGLQILGSLLKAAATKKTNQTGFASGGTVREGGVYPVGERGMERIFLPSGTRVQPNNEVMAYGGGGHQREELVARISGTDLAILLKRGEAVLSRNN